MCLPHRVAIIVTALHDDIAAELHDLIIVINRITQWMGCQPLPSDPSVTHHAVQVDEPPQLQLRR